MNQRSICWRGHRLEALPHAARSGERLHAPPAADTRKGHPTGEDQWHPRTNFPRPTYG
jgi:hypothetical protein